jgi:hypothetical protein
MRLRAAMMLLVTMSGLGCPSSGGSGGAAVPLDQLADELAQAFCHKAFTCCTTAERQTNTATSADEAACRTTVAPQLGADISANQSAIAAGTMVYHPEKARACLDVVAALSCPDWGGDDRLTRFPECNQMWEGKVAPGGACTRNQECIGGACSNISGPFACVGLPGLGEPCPTGNCQLGIACAQDASGLPTKCVALQANGVACSGDEDCASNNCTFVASASAIVCAASTMCVGM